MKHFSLIFLTLISFWSYGQKLSVTANGLRDINNNEKSYVVIHCEGKTALQLYDNALNYIKNTYKCPNDVIKGKKEGEYLRFIAHVTDFISVKDDIDRIIPISANFLVELSFKEGKVKLEIIALEMPEKSICNITLFSVETLDAPSKYEKSKVIFSGEFKDGYYIFNTNGELKKPKIKEDIEKHFNTLISSISEYLQGKEIKDNW